MRVIAAYVDITNAKLSSAKGSLEHFQSWEQRVDGCVHLTHKAAPTYCGHWLLFTLILHVVIKVTIS